MKNIDDYIDFLLVEKGEEINYRGQIKKALISDAKDKIDYHDDKFIRTNFEIQTGNIIEFQNNKWLIISEVVKSSKLTYKAKIRKSNYQIKIAIDELLYTFDSIIKGISVGIQKGKFINYTDGKIEVTLPADETSNKIQEDMRFLKMGKAWKITGIDKSVIGLNIIYCDRDVFLDTDDKVNEITNCSNEATSNDWW